MKLDNLYDITSGYVASDARDIILAGFNEMKYSIFWHPRDRAGRRGSSSTYTQALTTTQAYYCPGPHCHGTTTFQPLLHTICVSQEYSQNV